MTKKLMKGNFVVSEAALRAGVECYFGYPITPASEIAEYFAVQYAKGRVREFVQIESEVTVPHCLIGAAQQGKRTFTGTSSPGFSLMLEGISYAAGMDCPIVIADVVRGSPGLGDIFPSQQDYYAVVKGGHGGYRSIVLAPSSVQEMPQLTYDIFNLADEYLMPGFLMYDGHLGQLAEGIEMPEPVIKKFSTYWATQGIGNRDKEVYDGEIIFDERRSGLKEIIDEMDTLKAKDDTEKRKIGRGLPNTGTSLYIENRLFTERLRELREEKFQHAMNNIAMAEEYMLKDAKYVLVAYGSAAAVAKDTVNKARAAGIKAGLFRPITLSPFPEEKLRKATKRAKGILDLELDVKGQMIDDVRLALNGKKPVEFYGRGGGIIPDGEEVLYQLRNKFGCGKK